MIVRFWELKPFNISINFFAWNQVNHYKYFLLGEWNFLGGWGLKALWYACDSQVFSTQANVVETSSLVGHMVSSHRVYHSSQCFTSETFSIEISVCVCVLTFTTVECCDSDMTGSFYTPSSCWGWQHVFSFVCPLAVYEAPQTKPAFLDAPYHGPVWLFVSKRGCHSPSERGAQMKGLLPGPHLSPLRSEQEMRDWTGRHCKMEHGFGFLFSSRKRWDEEDTGHRWTETDQFFSCFCLFVCFLPLREEAILFEEIFSKYL